MAWTDPALITENGTVVFGPTLYNPDNPPIPQGPNIKEKIYRGINAGRPGNAILWGSDYMLWGTGYLLWS